MPMLKNATSRWDDQPLATRLEFFEEHRAGWEHLWNENGGNRDSIIKWAEDAGMSHPNNFFDGLHRFLFQHHYDPLKKCAALPGKFSEWLLSTARMHAEKPQDKFFYLDQGCTLKGYLRALERAAIQKNVEESILVLNSEMPRSGDKLYAEFLLAQAGYKDQMKALASELNRAAFEIEAGNDVSQHYEAGDELEYTLTGDRLSFLKKVDGHIVAANKHGGISVIEDVWNIARRG